jgi:hypothetical protein
VQILRYAQDDKPMKIFAGIALTTVSLSLAAQSPPRQTESDAYTRYELLAPGSAKFRIIY